MKADGLIRKTKSWTEFVSRLELLKPKEKGDAFEELIRLYLLSDPIFITKLANVWHHTEVPQSVIDELGLPQPEIGVDLVGGNDGSIDLYFGPKKPDGVNDKNWIQTIDGRAFMAVIRLYGADIAFFDQTWKPDDVVKVK